MNVVKELAQFAGGTLTNLEVQDDSKPPSISEKESISDGEPPNRDSRITDNLFCGDIFGRGQLLNRSFTLLRLNNSMDN